ncbi:MAG: hypothetical protein JSV33_06700 [bacterium]|nr:MAG: hypothetical protein JSV33_06700 [bacterium]
MSRRLFGPEGIVLSGFFMLTLFCCAQASDEMIHPDSWVYTALRKFELLGLIHLEPHLPYARTEISSYVDRILSNLGREGTRLHPHYAFLLDRLRGEFQGKEDRPGEREDPPIITYREGGRFVAFDCALGGVVQKRVDSVKGEADGLFFWNALVDLGWKATLETSYRLTLAPERELNRRALQPAPRQRSFRGLTAEYERAYIAFRGSRWRLRFGRDYLQWGSAPEEGLILSRTAGSLDNITASVHMGRFALHTFQAFLDPQRRRRLAGHRFTVRLPRGIFVGIAETVLYAGRDLEFAYLLPFGSYYANQYNEAGNDNILWSIDWKIPVCRGCICYGEFLIDDFQYEGDPPAPNRLGFNCTVESAVHVGGVPLELSLGYTRIDIYTYAHLDTLTSYLAGSGSASTEYLIGTPLGPDADRWRFKAAVPVHRRVVLAVGAELKRFGEGRDLVSWREGDDVNPPFPSGAVLKERLVSGEGAVDLGGGSHVRAGGGMRYRSGGVDGGDAEDGYAYLELIVDF